MALDLVSSARDGVLPWQVACEFVAASRKLRSQGFTAGDAWDRLADYLTIFPLILPSAGTFARARALHTEYGWSFWDAMIVAAWNAALRAFTQRMCQAAPFAVHLRS